MKISFHSYANKTNFLMKRFALSLTFIVTFTATRKWPIVLLFLDNLSTVVLVNYADLLKVNQAFKNWLGLTMRKLEKLN